MKTRRKIVEFLEPRSRNLEVRDVRIGLGYTAVLLDDNRAGVAFTLGADNAGCCSPFPGSRTLAGRTAAELLQFLASSSRLEIVVGLATANALANIKPPEGTTGDVLDAISLFPQDKVAMIGNFAPLVPALNSRVAKLDIFDEHEEGAVGVQPARNAFAALAACDVAIVTSTTLINDTIDTLLEAAANCREMVLLGSSTPLTPEVFRETPVTFLSGITIVDPAGILRTVSEGRGTRFFKPFVSKWNFPVRSSVARTVEGCA
jgi:uncharacterized protein